MKHRGLLGFKRFTGKGPLTVKQTGPRTLDDIEELVLEIIEDEDISTENPTDEEIDTVMRELADRMFAESETVATPIGEQSKSFAFKICMQSSWVEDWESGFRDVTTGVSSKFESLIVKANGCEGIIESDSPFATTLIMSEEECEVCDMFSLP